MNPTELTKAKGSEIGDVGIFAIGVDETWSLMDHDPAVRQGIFPCELHSYRSFPGDHLPE